MRFSTAKMLEIINAPVLLYLTLLCTLSALIPYFVKPIISCVCRPSIEERRLWSEMMKLKAEQKTVSMKDEFAAYSKIQRKIVKLESDLKDKSVTRASKNLALKGTLSIILQAFVGAMTLCSVIWFRYEPIVKFEADLSPLATLLSYPTKVPNSISAHMWVLISNYSIRTLLKSATT